MCESLSTIFFVKHVSKTLSYNYWIYLDSPRRNSVKRSLKKLQMILSRKTSAAWKTNFLHLDGSAESFSHCYLIKTKETTLPDGAHDTADWTSHVWGDNNAASTWPRTPTYRCKLLKFIQVSFWGAYVIWVKAFKNGPSTICGRQPLKKLKW